MSLALIDQDHAVASTPSPALAPPELADQVAVKIRNLSKHFGRGEQRVTAVDDVSWDVYMGQMSLITGPSGCGKTTLLSVIAGILNADEGSVTKRLPCVDPCADLQADRMSPVVIQADAAATSSASMADSPRRALPAAPKSSSICVRIPCGHTACTRTPAYVPPRRGLPAPH